MGRPEFRVKGEAFLVLSLWLLLMPLRVTGAMLLAAAVHEMGHLAVLWANGVGIWSVEVGTNGAKIETGPMEPKTELACALAGPAAGLLLCLFWQWIPEAAVIALIQSVFNLLPLYPLDGGRVLRAARNICCKYQ